MTSTADKLKIEYENYLKTLGLGKLQALGRHCGVHRPTDKRKNVLIADILSLLMGETQPCSPTTRGAPIKAASVSEDVLLALQAIEAAHYASEFSFPIKSKEEKKKNYALELDEMFQKHLQAPKNLLIV